MSKSKVELNLTPAEDLELGNKLGVWLLAYSAWRESNAVREQQMQRQFLGAVLQCIDFEQNPAFEQVSQSSEKVVYRPRTYADYFVVQVRKKPRHDDFHGYACLGSFLSRRQQVKGTDAGRYSLNIPAVAGPYEHRSGSLVLLSAEGACLEDILAERRLPARELDAVTGCVLAGIRFAHSAMTHPIKTSFSTAKKATAPVAFFSRPDLGANVSQKLARMALSHLRADYDPIISALNTIRWVYFKDAKPANWALGKKSLAILDMDLAFRPEAMDLAFFLPHLPEGGSEMQRHWIRKYYRDARKDYCMRGITFEQFQNAYVASVLYRSVAMIEKVRSGSSPIAKWYVKNASSLVQSGICPVAFKEACKIFDAI